MFSFIPKQYLQVYLSRFSSMYMAIESKLVVVKLVIELFVIRCFVDEVKVCVIFQKKINYYKTDRQRC